MNRPLNLLCSVIVRVLYKIMSPRNVVHGVVWCASGVCQVLARSSPDDKYLLVTRLNGTSLPRDREAWEEQHPQLNWNKHKDTTLPGYWDEVSRFTTSRLFFVLFCFLMRVLGVSSMREIRGGSFCTVQDHCKIYRSRILQPLYCKCGPQKKMYYFFLLVGSNDLVCIVLAGS